MSYAGKLLAMMREHFTRHTDAPYRDAILGEIIVISRTTGFGSEDGLDESLEEAAQLLGGKPSDILNPADPFTFGLPMLLHSEFMKAGTMDDAVERCQHNAFELVTDGFGRGSEKLVCAEAALLRCEFDEAKLMAEQSALDAAEKQQYFIMASAYFVLMRRALILGDTGEAAVHLADIRALIPTAIQTLAKQRITITMLREVLALAECFFYSSLKCGDDIPTDFLDGSHKSEMAAGLGVPQVYMARAMLMTGNYTGALRMCDSLIRLPNVSQCARLYSLILSALCRERYRGAGNGLQPLQTALSEGEKDGIVLPFAENPDILPLLKKCEHSGLSEEYLLKVRLQCEAYQNVAPKFASESVLALSEREVEVLRLIATGQSRREAAEALSVQEETVKKHLASAYKKLDAKGKTEAIRLAKTHGIL